MSDTFLNFCWKNSAFGRKSKKVDDAEAGGRKCTFKLVCCLSFSHRNEFSKFSSILSPLFLSFVPTLSLFYAVVEWLRVLLNTKKRKTKAILYAKNIIFYFRILVDTKIVNIEIRPIAIKFRTIPFLSISFIDIFACS